MQTKFEVSRFFIKFQITKLLLSSYHKHSCYKIETRRWRVVNSSYLRILLDVTRKSTRKTFGDSFNTIHLYTTVSKINFDIPLTAQV